MLSLRYKSRRAEPRGRPPSTVRTAGHLLGQKAQHHDPSADFAVRNQSSDISQQTASAPAKQHQQQQRQAAVDTVCAPNAAPRAAHDSVRESQHGSKSKKKKKQKRHSTGEDRGDGERGMKRMRLNSEAKINSNQLAAQEINCEELPSSQVKGKKADHCKQQQQTQQQKLQQQERQLLLVKQFSDRGAAAGVSSAVVDRLQGGRFRSLNEYLYTKKGNEAFARYQKEPQLFDIYHAGYRAQVRRWPLNPLDYVAAWLSKRPEEWIVGDFGCGEAALALRFPER
ncbi:KLLA0C11847p, related [Eimeria mitis]|uniref:Ribosomal RNA-processing protein 8 n=1 Tax=Eimeria mitis TaxID=44415 RepID=U6KN43_9EIME|nr:KLLA0C11847p, related [Eimeria mitis]CDJ36843.1 KLLA0C11847p, related [Eimeria mitis]